MGKNSKIEWTHHTFNPVWGCTKISPGCAHCYADAHASRYGFKLWGPGSERRTFGEKHWGEPLKWARAAREAGVRRRVFCGSMCDIFEDHRTLDAERERLWELVERTPELDWLLLTKRPERIAGNLPEAWCRNPKPNVVLGTSAEDQTRWDERVPHLMAAPAVCHFVSAEPLLGPIVMGGLRPSWLIVGGESGPHARPMSGEWVRALRDQCGERTKFFFKQWGGVNKWITGRELDGRTWDEIPWAQ